MSEGGAGLHPGSSVSFQSVLNINTVAGEETEEEKVEKHKTFVEKYAKEIKHFGKTHLGFTYHPCYH